MNTTDYLPVKGTTEAESLNTFERLLNLPGPNRHERRRHAALVKIAESKKRKPLNAKEKESIGFHIDEATNFKENK